MEEVHRLNQALRLAAERYCNNLKSQSMKQITIELRGRKIPACKKKNCENHCIWDYQTCWNHLTLTNKNKLQKRIAKILREEKDLSKLVLSGANFSGVDFSGANLSNSFLNKCDLSNCKFIDTNLESSFISLSNLKNADLSRANIHNAVFSLSNLYNVKLLAYSISFGRVPINLTKDSFSSSKLFDKYKIDETEPYYSEATYRALKTYFSNKGEYDSESWAAYRERLMQRKRYWQKKKYWNWISSLLFGSINGYGEKPLRVLWLVIFIVSLYSYLYYALNVLLIIPENSNASLQQSIFFSATTFCTMSVPGLAISQTFIGMFLVASEAFFGVSVLSLLIFTLTRRYIAR